MILKQEGQTHLNFCFKKFIRFKAARLFSKASLKEDSSIGKFIGCGVLVGRWKVLLVNIGENVAPAFLFISSLSRLISSSFSIVICSIC